MTGTANTPVQRRQEPGAEDESFEIGLLLVVYFALRCYGDKHLKFFVQGREWFFHDQVGPMFFAVEDDG